MRSVGQVVGLHAELGLDLFCERKVLEESQVHVRASWTAAFAVPAKTAGGIFMAPGTSGRDILRGPGSSNMDLALFKNFSFTEQVKAQFRVQAYNLTNTPHFANPDSDLNHGTFGQINSVQPNSWRQLELGLCVTF